MIGTSLGPYHILDKLGAGGMGEVYRERSSSSRADHTGTTDRRGDRSINTQTVRLIDSAMTSAGARV